MILVITAKETGLVLVPTQVKPITTAIAVAVAVAIPAAITYAIAIGITIQ